MNKHDDAAFDHAFRHAQMMQNNEMALSDFITSAEKDETDNALDLPKGDAKTSNDDADYQLNVIDDYKAMTISHEQSEQDKTRSLNQMREDESIRDLNILFIKICLTAIALWIVFCAVVNIFWGFA